MSVKPDLSKLVRATEDSFTGLLYADDAQIVETIARKHYGTPERVEVYVRIVDGELENQSAAKPETAGTLF
jgi:Holliday junction resolvase RusA-like endonuclease